MLVQPFKQLLLTLRCNTKLDNLFAEHAGDPLLVLAQLKKGTMDAPFLALIEFTAALVKAEKQVTNSDNSPVKKTLTPPKLQPAGRRRVRFNV